MDEKKGLKTWMEWQRLAWAGAAESAAVFPQITGVFIRRAGIACPTVLADGNECSAGLWDTEIVIECGSERRRVMKCDVCDTWWCRLLGA